VDGDAGFAKAMQLYWFLERVSFVPVGTATFLGDTRSFTRTFSAPSPDLTDLFNYQVGGAISGNIDSADPATPAAEPARRVCQGSELGLIFHGEATYPFAPTGSERADNVELYVRCVDGEWRLYYRFFFGINIPYLGGTNYSGMLSNPASPSIGDDVVVATGSFSLFGLTLAYIAHTRDSVNYTFTGAGLSATSEFWAF
jgi:hypothetical protein